MPKTHFKHYPVRPKRLTAEFVKREYAKLLKRLPTAEAAKSPKLWLELFADWNALRSYIGSESSRLYFAYSQNVKDKKLDAAIKYQREKIYPATAKPGYRLMTAFLASRHKSALLKKYGQRIEIDYEVSLKPNDPINTRPQIKVSRLCQRYNKLIAAAKAKVRAQSLTIVKAGALLESADPELRHAAFVAIREWYLKHHQQLAKLFNELLELRQQMARNVGLGSYIDLAYQNMGRTDYGPAEVANFRLLILKYFVPLKKKIIREQARQLGAKSLAAWDTGYKPATTLAPNIASVDTQLTKTQELFDKLGPPFGHYFRRMRARHLIDLENRPNKQSGPYCTVFTDEGEAAVFCNSTGSAQDIVTLTHEMGHAFQAIEASPIEAIDMQFGTIDLAEVFSTTMEYLCLPQIDTFFKTDDAKKYRQARWDRAVDILCYSCVVDEFQHWLYAQPKASPAARDKQWVELYAKYIPGLDWRGLQQYRALRWYAQGHIFNSPFYYIDYALAEVCAIQLALIDQKDHKKAMDIYLRLCRLGGTKSFLEAIKSVGLRSPFDEKLIASLAKHAANQLGV